MKITNVELSSESANVFSFGMITVPSTDKYLIKTMVGLDADEITHSFYGVGAVTNSKFHDFRINSRDIIMRIVANPNYAINETFSDLRDEMYRIISAGRSGLVNLLFMSSGSAIATISGYITKFEVPYFSKVPEFQISIKCYDPMFRGEAPVVLEAADLPSGSGLLLLTDALSTAPHGFSMQVDITGSIGYFVIQDTSGTPEWQLRIDQSFISGDSLYISSEFGNRYVYMDRSSTITHLMDKIDPGSVWPTIFPGTNQLYFPNFGSFDWVNVTFLPAYWGI